MIKLIGNFKCKKLGRADLLMVINSNKKWIYSQEEYVELLHMFIDRLNSQSNIKPLNVVIFEDENKESHKLDIQAVINNIYIKRDKPTDPLTKDEITAIRDLYKDKYSKSAISKVFGISRNTVNKYCNNLNG